MVLENASIRANQLLRRVRHRLATSGVYLEYIPCAASDRDSISGINRPEVLYQILREPLLPIERC